MDPKDYHHNVHMIRSLMGQLLIRILMTHDWSNNTLPAAVSVAADAASNATDDSF